MRRKTATHTVERKKPLTRFVEVGSRPAISGGPKRRNAGFLRICQPGFIRDRFCRIISWGAFGQGIARLQQGTPAATILLKLLIEPGTSTSVRARVADSVFNHASKTIEIETIEARVTELERTCRGGAERDVMHAYTAPGAI